LHCCEFLFLPHDGMVMLLPRHSPENHWHAAPSLPILSQKPFDTAIEHMNSFGEVPPARCAWVA
jgi:hypothetical protein